MNDGKKIGKYKYRYITWGASLVPNKLEDGSRMDMITLNEWTPL
jgi:hypothetical protein